MWCEGTKDSKIPWLGPWDLANQVGAVAYLSTWVSLPTPDSSLPLTSNSREYKEHKAHGPCSLSPESSEWPRDVKGALALLSHVSQAAQCQTKAVKVNLSLSHPVFRSESNPWKHVPRPKTDEQMSGRVGSEWKCLVSHDIHSISLGELDWSTSGRLGRKLVIRTRAEGSKFFPTVLQIEQVIGKYQHQNFSLTLQGLRLRYLY